MINSPELKDCAYEIASAGVSSAVPYENTLKALRNFDPGHGKLLVFSIGKAAVPMANAASDVFGRRISYGLIVTKYGYLKDVNAPEFERMEAGHPFSDENSFIAARKALTAVADLSPEDNVVVLLSGGGSALFEKPLVAPAVLYNINTKLLLKGAEITEINMIRKRISAVKGGKFASACFPAKVTTFALSDVLGNDKQTIASGITVPDNVSDAQIKLVAEKYLFSISGDRLGQLYHKTGLTINDGGYYIVGDLHAMCEGAKKKAEELGFSAQVVDEALTGEARDVAKKILADNENAVGRNAFIYGGETVVTVKGSGLGGRNQEMALSAAEYLHRKSGIAFISIGSDGTDGPTDAAGGFADGRTYDKIMSAGLSPDIELINNNSYYALKASGDLIITGATGTNVNDITVILTDR